MEEEVLAPMDGVDDVDLEDTGPLSSNQNPYEELEAQQAAPTDGGGEGAMFDEIMSELPEDRKEFVARYLTPETAMLLGTIMGQPAFEYFSKLADPTMILLPFKRDQAQAIMQELGGEADPTIEEGALPDTEATLV